MLGALGIVAILAAQPSVAVRSPYLDAVRRYGPGMEREAIEALRAIRLRDADQVLAELDDKICAAVGMEGYTDPTHPRAPIFYCSPRQIAALSREAQKKLAATWRRLYPRAVALHVEALAACDPARDGATMRLHLTVLLRLVVRIDELARENRDIPEAFARVATQGRHLTLWALQYLRDLDGLAAAVEAFEAAKVRNLRSVSGVEPNRDVDVRLARGALEELRAVPDAVAESARARQPSETPARDDVFAREERRRIEIAARVYETLLVDDPAVLEAHLRLARLELGLGLAERAEAHLVRVANLKPDARQAYLAALFLADVYERQGRIADAIAAYGVAQQNWPGAQTPGIGIARLRALAGTHDGARAALTVLHLERAPDAPPRSDPWMGYIGAQAWRLPSGIAALQASFEAEP
jgi:tetratricopeptide (TPR) repeat protein